MRKNFIVRIDEAIEQKCQQFSNWIYDWIAITNFGITRILAIIFSVLGVAGGTLEYVIYKNLPLCILLSMYFLLFSVMLCVVSFLIERKEKFQTVKEIIESIVIGIKKYRPISLLVILGSIIGSTFYFSDVPEELTVREKDLLVIDVIFSQTNLILFMFYLYFICCEKPPKRKNKWKELKEKFTEKIESLSPKPQFAPMRIKHENYSDRTSKPKHTLGFFILSKALNIVSDKELKIVIY
jgi:hypothetical protein